MSGLHLGLGLRQHAAFPRWSLRIALQILIKRMAQIWVRVERQLVHVEYIDVPSLDGMRWCDGVEREISQHVLGKRNWLDTSPQQGNKQIGR
jgi:hypothetical protein